MRHYAFALFCSLACLLPARPAHALDKVDPYICPTQLQGSGFDCFLEAIPQTYTMCRHIKHIEILEFGMTGAQEGVNGAKTESCIDKHRLSMTRPYQAALREAAQNKDEVLGLRKLYDMWLNSLAKLLPVTGETEDAYKLRVVGPYAEFSEQIKIIRASAETAPVAAAKPKPVSKKKVAQP
jgi:hypothetical protein